MGMLILFLTLATVLASGLNLGIAGYLLVATISSTGTVIVIALARRYRSHTRVPQ